jgi:hypothetical protein
MARFKASFTDILRGAKARKPVAFPRPSITAALLSKEPTEEVLVDLMPISGEEEAVVLTRARAFAVERGVADPKPGDPIYDLGLMVETLAVGCIDHESPPDAPARFFASAEEIRSFLDRERIVYLYELHALWQDELAPLGRTLSEDEYYKAVLKLADAEDPSLPFAMYRPAILGNFMLSMARQLRDLVLVKSPLGSSSSSDTTSEPSKAEAPS